MVGHAIAVPPREVAHAGQTVLEVAGLGGGALSEIALSMRAGEIVGIAGIEGNGQTELIECIAGLLRPSTGRILLEGTDITDLSVRRRTELGVGHIPADRRQRAVILDFTVEENSILGYQRAFSSPFGMRFSAMRAHADAIIKRWRRAAPGSNARDARPLRREPAEGGDRKGDDAEPQTDPCGPSDPRSRHRARPALASEARANGTAILLVSGELSELLALSDRLIVMFGGGIVGEVDPARIDERPLGLMMSGHAEDVA